MLYYIDAYSSGHYPRISQDRIFVWGRLSPADAKTNDPVPKPEHAQYVGHSPALSFLAYSSEGFQTEDAAWAVVHFTKPGQVALSCGPSSQSFGLNSGPSKIKLQLAHTDCSMEVRVSRNDGKMFSWSPSGYNYNTLPPNNNFNAFVTARTLHID